MTKRLKLIVNVTRDPRVHEALERTIVRHKAASGLFDREYMKSREELIEKIPSADVLLSFAVPEEAIRRAERLRWVHFASAGVEKSLSPALREKSIKLSCSRGIHASAIAEYVMMQTLAFAKNLRRAYHFQDKRQWRFEELLGGMFDLEGKTLTVIGLGSIGRRVAKLAQAFDMRVIGTVNNPRKIRFVDKVYPPAKLSECLKRADIIVLSVPLTEKTRHLLGAEQFTLMKQNALLVNIGRGKLVDERALIEALKAGRIAGAALDVFETEPLPADSPLWDMANVSVTPHYSGMAEGLWEKVGNLFCENAVRFRDGRRLLGIVSKEKGY